MPCLKLLTAVRVTCSTPHQARCPATSPLPTSTVATGERVRITELYGPHHRGSLLLLVGCLTSQQQASVSQERIYSDNFTCCHTEIEVADQTFYLTQSQYTDTGHFALQWLPCLAPGVIGSALGLVRPVSVYCDWLR